MGTGALFDGIAGGSYAGSMAATHDPAPVADWATDFDHHHPEWTSDPFPIWSELRDRCPMAHTDRYNDGVWLPHRFEDYAQIVHDTATFSSDHNAFTAGGPAERLKMPPIHTDPPDHGPIRRTVLPFFAPKRVQGWEPAIRAEAAALAAAVAERGHGDAAVDYAQVIPVGAIAAILGVDAGEGDLFRSWVYRFIEVGARDTQVREEAQAEIVAYMRNEITRRRREPSDDLISHLVAADIDGEPLTDDVIERMLVLQLIAGIDTTWSSIGAALWHLATNPEDRRRLAAEPELIPTANEEFLRAYAPVIVARRVTATAEVGDVTMQPGDTVMMGFPLACRDPEQFDRPDEVVIDRQRNRHVAFGAGIHRCLGSNLARLEMNVAIEEWMKAIPEFELAPDADVRWSEGQIRGPRTVPIVLR